MPTFLEAFDAVVKSSERGNLRAFAAKSGLSAAYLSEILTKGKLPTVELLNAALEQAAVPEKQKRSILAALSLEKAKAHPDSAAAVIELEAQARLASELALGLAEMLVSHGLQLPKALNKKLESLREPL